MSVKSPVAIIFDTEGNDAKVNNNRLLTDATVSGVVQVADNGGSLTVDGPLTDTELRASAVPISAASLPLPAGAATETTLSNFHTSFNNEDFAQEVTLSGLLAAFNAEDFATQATLDALYSAFSAEDFAQDATLQSLRSDFNAEDFAQEITQSGIKTELELLHTDFIAEDFATETTLAAIKDTDGIKRIEDPLPSGTNIIGKTYLTDGTLDASIVEDNGVNRLQTSTILTERAAEVKGVGLYKAAIAASTYYIAVDLDNASGAGPYKHTWTSGQWIYLVSAAGILIKDKPADEWDGRIGVILSINGTSATVGWFPMGVLHARDTSRFESTTVHESLTVPLSLKVTGGDLEGICLGWIQSGITAINTSTTLKDVRDNNVTPAVGDLIAYADKYAGSGTADLHYGIGYLVQ